MSRRRPLGEILSFVIKSPPQRLTVRKTRAKSLHWWTEAEKDIVRREYDSHWRTIDNLALRLGVSYHAVVAQAARMGIQKSKAPSWSPEETAVIQICHEEGLTMKDAWRRLLSKGFRRSLLGVQVKMARLNISRRIRDGWFTKREVCGILGATHEKVQVWIDGGNLKAQRVISDGITTSWRIEEKDLRNFVIRYREELIGRNVDISSLVELLVPGQVIS